MSGDPHVYLAPEGVLQNGTVSLLKLRHPRTDRSVVFALHEPEPSSDGKPRLFELNRQDSGFRSWLLADRIFGDGSLILLTPFDPLFLVLPYLRKAKARGFAPFADVVHDEELTGTSRIVRAFAPSLSHRLEFLCDMKQPSEELRVYRWNETRALKWLRKRWEVARTALLAAGVSCGASSMHLKASTNEGDPTAEEAAIASTALALLTDCLPPDVAIILSEELGVCVEPAAATTVPVAVPVESGTGGDLENAAKVARTSVRPSNDYSIGVANKTDVASGAPPKGRGRGRAPLKKQPGMQSITNFFGKPSKK